MRAFTILLSSVLLSVLAVACDDTPPGGDAGRDAGATTADGGADAGRDAGSALDAGPGADAGPDAGPASLDGGGGSTDAGAAGACASDGECDDGSSCTADRCVEGACVHSASAACGWPAEPTSDADNLTSVGGTEFSSDLSGAVWNPVSRTLWLCRNNGPSMVWALVEDGGGGFRIDTRGGATAAWSGFGDAEAVTQADFTERDVVYVLNERAGTILEEDLSVGGAEVEQNRWDLSAQLGGSGAEGMTFVPDAFLSAQGFVDASGAPYVSTLGMGGLMFVGHQGGGQLYVFDLDRVGGTHVFVGRYETGGAESAGLEFDRSTGQLLIWHDSDIDQLELTRLSSSPGSVDRRMDSIVTYDAPAPILFMSTNIEGVAVRPIEDCRGGRRDLFMTIDGGRIWSLFRYRRFPC